MKQSRVGCNSVVVQAVNQTLVEIDSLFIHFPTTIRNNAWPSDAKPIMLDAQFSHQLDISFVSMVVVAGNGTCITVEDTSKSSTEGIPYTGLTTP